MADISNITLPDGDNYNLKDLSAAESIESTGGSGVRLKKRDGSSFSTSTKINTQDLVRPTGLRGLNDSTLQTLVSTFRANRLAFLPADQIIIERTIDGGTTWTDAGVNDAKKLALFSETRPSVYIPRINDAPNLLCGLRITFTAMKYDVPEGTAETEKYNYWSSEYVKSTERYCQLKEIYFWLSSNNNSIGVIAQRANGATPNNWINLFNDSSFFMTGWSGADYISFSPGTFGGSKTQTGQPWNYRLILMTKGANGTSTMGSSTTAQSISEIRGYGDIVWTIPNQYMANDHMYSKDANQNVTFPAQVTATNFAGKINNYTVNSDVPSNAVFTDTPSIYFGHCATAAATADKVVELDEPTGFTLRNGVMICVSYDATNTASNVTLNVEGTGAKAISYVKNTAYTGTSNMITGHTSYYTYYVYNGTYWCFVNYSANTTNNANTVPSAQCETAAGTAAKAATCTNYSLKANSYLHVNLRYANTAQSALTFNVNSKGAKPIYINGTASSSSNYTLPAGTYIVFYNGTYWDFRTDDKLPANIDGDAATVNGHSVNKDVPSDAVFTDTKDLSQMTGTLPAARLATSGVTAGSAGPTANITGNENSSIAIPRLIVDQYGRVTALSSYTLTNKNATYSVGTGLTMSGSIISNAGVTGIKGSEESEYSTGDVTITKYTIGLGNVENKDSALIRSELTASDVNAALGFTPYTKSEVNSLISSVYVFKGTKATYAEITALTTQSVGDVWYCTATEKSYAWNGTDWNELGTVFIENYFANYSGVFIRETTAIHIENYYSLDIVKTTGNINY